MERPGTGREELVSSDKARTTTGAIKEPKLPSAGSKGVVPLIPNSGSILSELNGKLLSAAGKGDVNEVESLLRQGAEINTKDHPDGRTPLHLATRKNHHDVVQLLLQHDLDINIQDECSNLTPLAIAAAHAFETVLEALLKYDGINLNTKDKSNRRSPLHIAARGNHIGVVKALLDHGGAEVNTQDKWEFTPLHLAAREGYDEIVQALLSHGANINAIDEDKNSPLHLAARNGVSTTVKVLLNRQLVPSQRVAINIRNKAEETPLHCASKKVAKSDAEVNSVVKFLLEGGADINARDKDDKETPLHVAARSGSKGAVEALLSFNNPVARNDSDISQIGSNGRTADVNLENGNKYTPLSIAIRHGWPDVVSLMLDRALPPADLKLKGPLEKIKEKVSVLENAIRKGNDKIVKIFLQDTRATYNEKDTPWDSDLHCTPLTWAAKEGKKGLVEILLESHAQIDRLDSDSITPLQMASRFGYEDITRCLLDHQPKPDVNLKGKDDWTALHYASSAGKNKIVQLLLDRGADLCARTKQVGTKSSDTPLSLAASGLHTKCIEAVLNKLRGTVRNSPQPEAQALIMRCLGLDENGRGAQYSYEAVKSAAEHEDTQDLVKFILKQREFVGSRIFGLEGWSTESSSAGPGFWSQEICDFRRQIDNLMDPNNKQKKESWNALQWAVYHGEVELVEKLLVSSNKKDVEVRKSAERLAWNMCEDVRKKREAAEYDANQTQKVHDPAMIDLKNNRSATDDHSEHEADTGENPRQTSRGEAGARSRRQSTTSLPAAQEEMELEQTVIDRDNFLTRLSRMEENYLNIRDSLQYGIPLSPGLVKVAERERMPLAPSLNVDQSMKAMIDDFFVSIIDIFADGDGVAFLRRSRRVEKVIYEMGPKAIMESARASTKSQIAAEEGQREAVPETNRKDEDLRLRWIHLPANNLTWMEDLTSKLLVDKRNDDVALEKLDPYLDSQEFLRQSPHQLPKGKSEVHFMKPTCVEYYPKTLPQLSLVEEAETYKLLLIEEAKTYGNLFDAYKNKQSIVHGSRTLDEFFYHSLSDTDAQRDLQYRNKDQVTTKRIRHVMEDLGASGYWTIIRIDQLWLWIFDDKTIISSSTHRMDDKNDPILDGIWEYMNSEDIQNGRASLPSSPYEMAKLITEFGIEFFYHSTCAVGGVEESMQEIYKNAINQATRNEALLFDTFTEKVDKILKTLQTTKAKDDETLEKDAQNQVEQNFLSIKEASALLKEIKDIRDELNMLKAVLTQQESVWNELHGPNFETKNLRGPAYGINNIEEMDKQAQRVQDAVLSVLGLEQNEASIQEAITSREQAQESIKQGRTLMVFTIVTIIFLPGSFLASLFALNIAVFPHKGGDTVYWPNWAFAVIFGLTISLSTLIIGFAFYLDSVKKAMKKRQASKLNNSKTENKRPPTMKGPTKPEMKPIGTLPRKKLSADSNPTTTKSLPGLIGSDFAETSPTTPQPGYSIFKRKRKGASTVSKV